MCAERSVYGVECVLCGQIVCETCVQSVGAKHVCEALSRAIEGRKCEQTKECAHGIRGSHVDAFTSVGLCTKKGVCVAVGRVGEQAHMEAVASRDSFDTWLIPRCFIRLLRDTRSTTSVAALPPPFVSLSHRAPSPTPRTHGGSSCTSTGSGAVRS